jgi:hypothetical protein
MTHVAFDDDGVDATYEGVDFRLDRELVEEATEKSYYDVTDHEVLALIDDSLDLEGEPRRIGDILDD